MREEIRKVVEKASEEAYQMLLLTTTFELGDALSKVDRSSKLTDKEQDEACDLYWDLLERKVRGIK